MTSNPGSFPREPTRRALAFLRETADEQAQDAVVAERLITAQDLLSEDLGEVERWLLQAADLGPDPGRAAAKHLVELGGKRIRPAAVLLTAACFGPVPSAVHSFAVAVELIHSATLLHDDVLDEGEERRGRPAARVVWGNAASVLGGDLLLTQALLGVQESAPLVLPDLLRALRQLVEGEVVQLRARLEHAMERGTYESILRDKTAALFRLATVGSARLAEAPDALVEVLGEFGECVGMAFQLVDDLLDYASHQTGKGPLADLRQGKLTLPLVLAVEREPRLMESVRAVRTGNEAAMTELHRRVLELGCCEPVRERARAYTTRALALLERLPARPPRRLLEQMVEQLAARTH